MPIIKYYMINQLDQSTLNYININKIKRIRFNHLFNQDVSLLNQSPSITHIIFGNGFNKSIDNLQINLIFIYFGNNFNQPINKIYNKLKYLFFSLNFNNTLLPQPNLKVLKLGRFYNKYIDFSDFKGLQYLTLSSQYNQPIHCLPKKIQYLKLGRNFNNTLPSNFPTSMKKLIINAYYKHLLNFPIHLKHLNLGVRYNHRIDFRALSNLEILQLSQCYSYNIENFSTKLKELEFGFAQSVSTNICHLTNLKKLTIYNDYRLSYIPQTIEHLSIKIIDNRKINLVNFIRLKVLNLFILVNNFIFENIFDYLPLNLDVIYISDSGLLNIKNIELVSNIKIINKYMYCDVYPIF
jgi:hypothetical protein